MAGSLHRLNAPALDDRRLIDVTLGELRALVREVITETQASEPEQAITATEFAKLIGTDPRRVRAWYADGMPGFMTGDKAGLRIFPSKAQAWLLEHRHD